MKRALATAGLVACLALFAALSPVSAQTPSSTGQPPGRSAAAEPPAGAWYGAADKSGQQAHQDEIMRTMYVTMGAMAGYMFAVMPVTTAAVSAAVASGVVSYWAYDYLMPPSAPTE